MLFCHLRTFFQNLLFQEIISWIQVRVSSSWDPDQARHFVGPDLDPHCLKKSSVDHTYKQRVKVFWSAISLHRISCTFKLWHQNSLQCPNTLDPRAVYPALYEMTRFPIDGWEPAGRHRNLVCFLDCEPNTSTSGCSCKNIEDIQIFGMNMPFISSREAKNAYFMSAKASNKIYIFSLHSMK